MGNGLEVGGPSDLASWCCCSEHLQSGFASPTATRLIEAESLPIALVVLGVTVAREEVESPIPVPRRERFLLGMGEC